MTVSILSTTLGGSWWLVFVPFFFFLNRSFAKVPSRPGYLNILFFPASPNDWTSGCSQNEDRIGKCSRLSGSGHVNVAPTRARTCANSPSSRLYHLYWNPLQWTHSFRKKHVAKQPFGTCTTRQQINSAPLWFTAVFIVFAQCVSFSSEFNIFGSSFVSRVVPFATVTSTSMKKNKNICIVIVDAGPCIFCTKLFLCDAGFRLRRLAHIGGRGSEHPFFPHFFLRDERLWWLVWKARLGWSCLHDDICPRFI